MVWKGFSDIFYISLVDFVNIIYNDNSSHYNESIVVCGIIGYMIFFIVIFIESFLVNYKFKSRMTKFIEDIILFVSFFGVVAVWIAWWSFFTYLVSDLSYKYTVLLAVHFGLPIICCLCRVSACLNGPAGSSKLEGSNNDDIKILFSNLDEPSQLSDDSYSSLKNDNIVCVRENDIPKYYQRNLIVEFFNFSEKKS